MTSKRACLFAAPFGRWSIFIILNIVSIGVIRLRFRQSWLGKWPLMLPRNAKRRVFFFRMLSLYTCRMGSFSDVVWIVASVTKTIRGVANPVKIFLKHWIFGVLLFRRNYGWYMAYFSISRFAITTVLTQTIFSQILPNLILAFGRNPSNILRVWSWPH